MRIVSWRLRGRATFLVMLGRLANSSMSLASRRRRMILTTPVSRHVPAYCVFCGCAALKRGSTFGLGFVGHSPEAPCDIEDINNASPRLSARRYSNPPDDALKPYKQAAPAECWLCKPMPLLCPGFELCHAGTLGRLLHLNCSLDLRSFLSFSLGALIRSRLMARGCRRV